MNKARNELTLIDKLKVARATNSGIRLGHASVCAMIDLVSFANDQLLASDRNRTHAMRMLQSARRRLNIAMLVLAFDLSLFVATIALILLKVLP